jgi:oligo-1,6-glucosidase
MENVPLHSIDEVDDISSLDNYQVALRAGVSPEKALKAVERFGRDNARTPFQWTGEENAGFTSGKPWLRVNPNYKDINLERQISDPDSVYRYYQKLTALRRDPRYKETLVWGDLIPYLADVHNVFSYFRKSEDQTILVIANYQKEARHLPLPGRVRQVLLTNCQDPQIRGGMISLSGYQAALLLMEEACT